MPALQASTATISEAFQAADADTIILAGASAQDWPSARDEDTSYRPKLLFLDSLGLSAFATNETTTDTSILDGALAGGGYGPNQARFEEPGMQACIQTLADAGVEVPAPDDVGDDPSNQPFQAAFQACPDIAVLRAWLGAAGEDLNYGTLDATIDGLEVSIPGDPEPRTYGRHPMPTATPPPTSSPGTSRPSSSWRSTGSAPQARSYAAGVPDGRAPTSPTRERILDAALDLFVEQGVRGTTISDIERQVGLAAGTGSFYRHFPSKEVCCAPPSSGRRPSAWPRSIGTGRRWPSDDPEEAFAARAAQTLRDMRRFDRLLRLLLAEPTGCPSCGTPSCRPSVRRRRWARGWTIRSSSSPWPRWRATTSSAWWTVAPSAAWTRPSSSPRWRR